MSSVTGNSGNHRDLNIILAGNPNSGKTSVFNHLTGARHSVGNYPGITVERISGSYIWKGRKTHVTDLPGIYSLTAQSPEEKIAREVILRENPDLVVNVVNGATLERSLYLTMQLLELNVPVLLVVNMWDVVRRRGLVIDLSRLENLLKVKVVTTVGSRGIGIQDLMNAIDAHDAHDAPAVSVPWLKDTSGVFQRALEELRRSLTEEGAGKSALSNALILLDQENSTHGNVSESAVELATKLRDRIQAELPSAERAAIPEMRYDYIESVMSKVTETASAHGRSWTDRLDRVLLNRYLGIPVFLVMMYLVFTFTFALGEPLMGIMEQLFGRLGSFVNDLWPQGSESILRDLLVQGVIGGVGGVLIFLPNIILLFLAIAILEDSGYMARVAFIMDEIMRKVGLQGKSFVPLLTGFGCTVPAILATRTLENRSDRFTTIMIAPLMSCGARLPIYMMIIPAFFPDSWRAPMVWLIYVLGIATAFLAAKILRSKVFTGDETHLLLELPSYHIPTPITILSHTWDRAGEYIKKAGTVILAISVVLWVMSSFPVKSDLSRDYDSEITDVALGEMPEAERTDSITALENEKQSEVFMFTITGRVGTALEPVMKPLGFDWRVTTALIGAVAAKEAFVSQLGVVFAVGDPSDDTSTLRDKLRENYTPLQGLAMMVFALISSPCIATVAVTRKETGSWKWAFLQLAGLTILAYVMTFLVYQGGRLLL